MNIAELFDKEKMDELERRYPKPPKSDLRGRPKKGKNVRVKVYLDPKNPLSPAA